MIEKRDDYADAREAGPQPSSQELLARFQARERRLDAGCAFFGVLWLLPSTLAEWFGFRWYFMAAGVAVATFVGIFALRYGDGRVANRINKLIFNAKDE